MIKIGILGDIGSGKSYVAKQFGCPVFDADAEVTKIYKKNKNCFNKLKNKLPKYIYSFPIKKKEIGKAIIENKNNLKKIIKIVHPIVRKNMYKFLKNNNFKKAIVLDIPLYFENKLNKKTDVIIFISAKKKLINAALKKRGKSDLKLLKKIGKFQLPLQVKKKKADYVIINNFKSENLKNKVKILKYKILNK